MLSSVANIHQVLCVLMIVLAAAEIQGQQTVPLTASPTMTMSMSVNASIDGNFTGIAM